MELIVKKVHLTHTIFQCANSGKIIHIPHSKLGEDYIENLSRTSRYFVRSVIEMGCMIDEEEMTAFNHHVKDHLQSEEDSILRYHHMPVFSRVPIKPEDVEAMGIQVVFRRNQWVCTIIIYHVLLELSSSDSWSNLQSGEKMPRKSDGCHSWVFI